LLSPVPAPAADVVIGRRLRIFGFAVAGVGVVVVGAGVVGIGDLVVDDDLVVGGDVVSICVK